jgi:PEGA domain
VQKSVLLAAIQQEIQRHDFSHFLDEPRSIAQGGKGVVVGGCPACRKRINTTSQFLDHLANDAMPALLDIALASGLRRRFSSSCMARTSRSTKRTEITAYINGDIPLDPAKFQPQVAASPASATSTTQNVNDGDPVLTSVEVKSSPNGADITVDEKYMGSTPSTLKLTAGDHKIKLEKSGFKVWERTLTVSIGAAATINPTLEK